MNTFKKILLTWLLVAFVLACKQPSDSQMYKNDHISQRVDSLLNLMTLDEKIGQTVLFTSRWDVTGPVLREGEEEAIKSGS